MHHSEARHAGRATVAVGNRLDGLEPRRFGADIVEHETRGRRFLRPQAVTLLGQDARHGRHQSVAAFALPDQPRHAACRLQDIVVVGTARERHAAGHRQVARQRQSEFVGIDLHRDREAAIQLHQIELRWILDAPFGQRRAARQACTVASAEIGTGRHRHHVARLRAGPGVNPARTRDSERLGLARGTKEQGGRLVDAPVGAVMARVWKGLERISLRGLANLGGTDTRSAPGVGVVHGNFREPFEHRAQPVTMVVDGPSPLRSPGRFEDGIQRHRQVDAGPHFSRMAQVILRFQADVRLGLLLALARPLAGDLGAQQAEASIAADDHCCVDLAGGDA